MKLIIQYLFYVQPFVNRKSLFCYLRGYFSSDFLFYISFTYLLHFIIRAILYSFFTILYYCNFPLIERYHINTEWPWKNNKGFIKKITKTLLMFVCLNIFVFFPLSYISYDESIFKHKMDPELIPEWHVSFIQIMIALILYDNMFYWLHRTLHQPKLYWIHKMHHEYPNVVAFADVHSGLLDIVITNIIPTIIVGIIIDMHMYTIWMQMIILYSLGIQQHSGYDFPIFPLDLIPLCNTYRAHNNHHKYSNANYAPFWTYLDRLFGTFKA